MIVEQRVGMIEVLVEYQQKNHVVIVHGGMMEHHVGKIGNAIQ